MAKRYSTGRYTPKNPSKYVGTHDPIWRSSWEMAFMQFLDNHPKVSQWASESIKIPYRNPFTGKGTVYVPDFFILYEDKNGKKHAEVIEIKPAGQTHINEAKSKTAKFQLALNYAKWNAAEAYCKRNGLKFRVVTERDLFRQAK